MPEDQHINISPLEPQSWATAFLHQCVHIFIHTLLKQNPKLCKSLLMIPVSTVHNSHQLMGGCNTPLHLNPKHLLPQGRTSQGTNAPQHRAADALRRCSDTEPIFFLLLVLKDKLWGLNKGPQNLCMHHCSQVPTRVMFSHPSWINERLSSSGRKQQQWNSSVKLHRCFILHAVLHAKLYPYQTNKIKWWIYKGNKLPRERREIKRL